MHDEAGNRRPGRRACNAGDQNTSNVGKGVGLGVFFLHHLKPFIPGWAAIGGVLSILSAVYLAVHYHIQIQAKEHCEHVPIPS